MLFNILISFHVINSNCEIYDTIKSRNNNEPKSSIYHLFLCVYLWMISILFALPVFWTLKVQIKDNNPMVCGFNEEMPKHFIVSYVISICFIQVILQ